MMCSFPCNAFCLDLSLLLSMDMLAVDLTGAPDACPGDPVELWGRHVSVDEVAQHAGTIGYELLTGITARVPRLYEDSGNTAAG